MSILSVAFLFLFLLCPYLSLAQGNAWCSSGSDKSGTTGKTPSDLSAGWCRSWTFASNIANNKFRAFGLDGGATASDGNDQHNYMISVSLDQSFDLTDGSQWQLTLLPTSVPNLKGSALWSNADNSSLYIYGGRAAASDAIPNGNDIPTLDVASNQWSVSSSVVTLQRLASGAWVNVPELKRAYYIGGYQDKDTSTSTTDSLAHYAKSMFQFDTSTNTPSSIDAPFLPVQNGIAFYIPKGDGLLVYFGGEAPNATDADSNTKRTVNAWNYVWIYDTKSNKWYKQNTGGSAPSPRTEVCGSLLYDDATNTWQIWVIGGADYSTGQVLSTVDVLSIPSFQWFTASKAAIRMSASCTNVGPQIFVFGGRTEDTGSGGSDYGSPAFIYDVNKQATANTYLPSSTSYAAPTSVKAAIATSSTPSSWADPALQALFVKSSTTSAISAPTNGSGSGSSGGKGISGGAIAGIVLGALAGIAIFLGGVLFILRRRKKARTAVEDHDRQPYVQEKSELDARGTERRGTSPVYEVSSGIARPKYEMDDTSIRRGERVHELT